MAAPPLTAMLLLTFTFPWLGRHGVIPGSVGSGIAGGLIGSWAMALAVHLLARPWP